MRKWSGIATLTGVTLFILVVIMLHLLQPDYQFQEQLMSELALGKHGWAMSIAFGGVAMAFLGVLVGVRAFDGLLGYQLLLGITALFFVIAGMFPLGETSLIHISAISIAFVLSVLAMYLFPTSAGRASIASPKALSWLLAIGVAASIALGHTFLPMGIGQRLAALCLLLWLGIIGWWLSFHATSCIGRTRGGGRQ